MSKIVDHPQKPSVYGQTPRSQHTIAYGPSLSYKRKHSSRSWKYLLPLRLWCLLLLTPLILLLRILLEQLQHWRQLLSYSLPRTLSHTEHIIKHHSRENIEENECEANAVISPAS